VKRVSLRVFAVLALAVAVGLAVGVSPYASASPDGLERVAEDEGFAGDGRLHSLQEANRSTSCGRSPTQPACRAAGSRATTTTCPTSIEPS
jgi:hypothetical protein